MLRWLFLDMNSYFASVEQHLQPHLRNRPIAVAAVDTDHTSCIAASYQAKAFGIHTGTPVGMARHLCPGLIVVLARPHLYVEMHHKILAIVENHLHVDNILSIDEVACRLPSNESSEDRVRLIALAIKDSLLKNIGPAIRCSIGIAPNRFLAKVASDLQKPDGLTVLHPHELPQKILHLEPRDLPGVGKAMQLRLAIHGGDTMQNLWNLTAEQLALAFGGRIGLHFHRNLHGENVVEAPTKRHTIGHSSVLSPRRRTDAGAFAILIRLVHKVGARLRSMNYAAAGMVLHIHYEDHNSWKTHVRLPDVQDTQTLIEAMDHMWQLRPRNPAPQSPHHGSRPEKSSLPKKVGIVLFGLELTQNLTLPLFTCDTRRLDLARAMDDINGRYGRQRVYFAEMHETKDSAPLRIAFNSVPEENW
ncbi:MAG TPA: DNA polymerase [Phycisphaerae bacterium]|jgi:DNA polymerase-4